MGQGMGKRAWTKKRNHGQSMVGGGHLWGSPGHGGGVRRVWGHFIRAEKSRTAREEQSRGQHCGNGLCWNKLGRTTGCQPPPLPSSMIGKAGKNHLNKEITPLLPTGIGERFSQTISNLGHAAGLGLVVLGGTENLGPWGGGGGWIMQGKRFGYHDLNLFNLSSN
jgi:hypothetical protein